MGQYPQDLGANIQQRVTGGIWSSCMYEPTTAIAEESLRRLVREGRMKKDDLRIQPLTKSA